MADEDDEDEEDEEIDEMAAPRAEFAGLFGEREDKGNGSDPSDDDPSDDDEEDALIDDDVEDPQELERIAEQAAQAAQAAEAEAQAAEADLARQQAQRRLSLIAAGLNPNQDDIVIMEEASSPAPVPLSSTWKYEGPHGVMEDVHPSAGDMLTHDVFGDVEFNHMSAGGAHVRQPDGTLLGPLTREHMKHKVRSDPIQPDPIQAAPSQPDLIQPAPSLPDPIPPHQIQVRSDDRRAQGKATPLPAAVLPHEEGTRCT